MVEVTIAHRSPPLNGIFGMTEPQAGALINNPTNSTNLIAAGITAHSTQ